MLSAKNTGVTIHTSGPPRKTVVFFTVFNNFSSSAFKTASPKRHASALVIDGPRAIASYRRSLAHDVLSFQKTIRLLGLGLSRAPSSVGTNTGVRRKSPQRRRAAEARFDFPSSQIVNRWFSERRRAELVPGSNGTASPANPPLARADDRREGQIGRAHV